MILCKDTPKNRIICDKIADLEVDLEMFHRDWTDEVIDKKLEEISELYGQLE